MNRNIKLIWDFNGEDGLKTAEHHVIHLKEFDIKENTNALGFGVETINPLHSIAFMIVKESIVFTVRDALLPHRAEIAE